MIPAQRQRSWSPPLPERPSPEDAQLQWHTHLDQCPTCRLGSSYCTTGRAVLAITSSTDRRRTGGTR